MKTVTFTEYGGPEVLRVMDLPDPLPGEGEVLIRVRSVGVNHFDLDIRAGTSRIPLDFPHILGMELAGEIAAIGTGVDGWAIGDRVSPLYQLTCRACAACEAGQHMHCVEMKMRGVQSAGGYADLSLADARDLIRLPNHLSWSEAVAIQLTYGTAWHCLVTRAQLRPGETVIVSAAGSGVGTAAVQIAKLMGARVIATAGSDSKLDRAREEGADEVINYSTEDVTAAVLGMTEGRGADVAFEHVGDQCSNLHSIPSRILDESPCAVAMLGKLWIST